jgi:acyl carrier protein
LIDKSSAAQVETTVHKAITELLERSGKQAEAETIDNSSPLVAIGLTSLDLAALVAMLQARLKVDPFFAAKAITDVRTVGDLCRAYREFIEES